MSDLIISNIIADKNWTLFLDRDGVINKHLPDDYVKSPEDFIWLPNVLDALKTLSGIFSKIIVVTNQRGIAKGLYSEADLLNIHNVMLNEVRNAGARIDAIYYCPHFGNEAECNCRKPNSGMALKAQSQFPEIDFNHAIMVGDSKSDIDFGKNLKMWTVTVTKDLSEFADMYVKSLYYFSTMFQG
ncbi:MAG: HAD family hydrolase [Chitinophagales bacterium]|nr:HAD family hydrolase [Bacteroidota bacterium]MBP7400254.1 HAD family hydrolase [Chitinophagales bacterium]MBP8892716.1 HAD family hydrolase [Saprospiraceae bacterium]MBK8681911.1 HAD family hydrolase [Bacteroidota bacterium]MBP9190149.1 HAD family hydrolase [Chitinophagales bacterium]